MSTEPSHLSRIQTLWSVVRRAHDGSEETVRNAQQAILDLYGGAVRRYLRASLRDDDAANEVFQEFALRFVRGDFHSANPERGRFRDFVKTSLHHLIVDFRRKSARQPKPLALVPAETADQRDLIDEETFHRAWRQELLDRSWAALAEQERTQGTLFYSALKLLANDPSRRSHEIASQLDGEGNGSITAGNARVIIHRARKFFADQLVNEVAQSLDSPSYHEIERELMDLTLLGYCQSALARWRESQPDAETPRS